jgi:hypothetical protein
MRYQVYTAVNVVEADTRLEAIEKFCNSVVVILLDELIQEKEAKRTHEFIRQLNGTRDRD